MDEVYPTKKVLTTLLERHPDSEDANCAPSNGEPVPVHYNLLIHHCPYERIDRTEEEAEAQTGDEGSTV